MANFEVIPTYTVTVGVNDADGGYVTDEDNNSVDGTTITGLLEGETVVLTAVKYDDYNFTGWTVTDGVTYTTDGNDITITIGKSDVTVMANFEEEDKNTLSVVVTPANSGTVYMDGIEMTVPAELNEGDVVILTAFPAENYEVEGMTVTAGDGTIEETADGWRFTMGTESSVVTATFKRVHVHTWSAWDYEWAGDYSTCTATRVCEDNAEHTETVSGTVTSTTTPATCEEAGVIVYTATFEGEGLETQVFPVEIPALGHDWGEPTYEWSKDHTTCTAKRVCKRDASHVEEETGTATVATEGGVTVYTVTYENEAFETQTYRPHLDITMSEYGFLSLYADKAYVVPSDLTAIIYTGISGRVLTYQQLTVIPAYTGVVFWGRANRTYSLAETTTTDDYSSVNMLSGTLTETVIPNDGNVHYILTRLEGTNQGGLYWPYGTVNGVGAFTNHKGKAYLTIPASAGFAPRYFTLQGRACEEGTAVDETEADGDGKYYDILGREVREPQPQQIYIHNGKKVLYGE